MLETKVLVTYFLSKVDYQINKDMLENEFAYFSVISQLQCEFELTKKYKS